MHGMRLLDIKYIKHRRRIWFSSGTGGGTWKPWRNVNFLYAANLPFVNDYALYVNLLDLKFTFDMPVLKATN